MEAGSTHQNPVEIGDDSDKKMELKLDNASPKNAHRGKCNWISDRKMAVAPAAAAGLTFRHFDLELVPWQAEEEESGAPNASV